MGSIPQVTHKDFDVDDVLSELTIEEKIALISGTDFWHTASVPRLGVPAIRVSDGPNGVRGTKFFNGVPAACLPCGTALAATWDTDLIERGGKLQATEAIAKGASVILGPTTNMQRSPLGGRGFESFSEDPVLAGKMSAATINGMQSLGVGAALKHFVANDQEDKRMISDSIVTDRALREIYLKPFQIAQRDSKPWCYMTAYNRVNGVHASESPKLLNDILRKEWGFDGLIMSDWFGVYSTTASIKAGLDLEMPGPSYMRGKRVPQEIGCGKLHEHYLDDRVREVLKLVKKVLPLGIPENAPEHSVDTKETSALLRQIGSNGLVLLKNEDNILPFKKEKTTAVIGPNADMAAYCGGGSAGLAPYYAITPLEGVRGKFGALDSSSSVKYALGVPGWKKLPLITFLTKTPATESEPAKAGMTMKVFLEPANVPDRKPIDTVYITDSNALLVDYEHPKLPANHLYYCTFDGTFTPEETASYDFGLSVAGTGKLFVDGKVVVDNETVQYPGDSFFGSGSREEIGQISLEAGKTYAIHVTFGTLPTCTFNRPGVTPFGAGGIRIGGYRSIDRAAELNRAIELAKSVDQVVLCVGLNSDWEAEGYDRTSMCLPEGSDALISAICAANPNTAVIVQSGTPVTMPWRQEARAIVQAWYGGNETGNAIADVVFGDVNPSGKLPLSFPQRNEDNPAFLNYRCERGRVLYGEDIYVGYRFYERTRREVAFAFGHGLSYTSFELSDVQVSQGDEASDEISVAVTVANTGSIPGAQVVQVYVAPETEPSVNRPVKELKGFTKVQLDAGEKKTVTVTMSRKYATSFWDEERDSWVSEKGFYTVLVGDSSAHTPLKATFEVKKTSWWKGL